MKKIKFIFLIILVILFIVLSFILNQKENPYNKYNIKDYNYNQAIIKVKDRIITVAPLNYDGDAKEEFKDDLFTLKLNNQVSYYRFTINSVVKNKKKKSKYKYNKINEKDAFEEININGTYAYIWLNNDKVEKIVFYGETIIQK